MMLGSLDRLWPAIVPNTLLTEALAEPRRKACTFSVVLSRARLAYLWDHVVSGRLLLPAAAFFEAAAAAGRSLHGKPSS